MSKKGISHHIICFMLLIAFGVSSKAFCGEYSNPSAKNSPVKASPVLLDSLSRVAVGLGSSVNFPMADFRNFSKVTMGAELSVEYEFLAQFIPYVTTGTVFKAEFQNFFTSRPEISDLREGLFSQGLWFRFYLPNEFLIQADFSLGLAIMYLNAQSVDAKKIDDIYYDFLFNTGLSVRRVFAKTPVCNFLWNVKVPYTVQFEKTGSINMLGISLSVIVDFKPLAKRK